MKKVKGELNGLCNVSACKSANWVEYYNHSTRKHYCKSCANKINVANHVDAMRLYGHELCTKVEIKVVDNEHKEKREKLIQEYAEFMTASGFVNWSSDDHYDVLVNGCKGYKDLTDNELVREVSGYVGDDNSGPQSLLDALAEFEWILTRDEELSKVDGDPVVDPVLFQSFCESFNKLDYRDIVDAELDGGYAYNYVNWDKLKTVDYKLYKAYKRLSVVMEHELSEFFCDYLAELG